MFSITVQRQHFFPNAIIGDLSVNGAHQCFTLELPLESDGLQNVQGKTAIPAGAYDLTIDFSNRFSRLMPHVLDVPGRSGIRIHYGNSDVNTEGCLLVGSTAEPPDWVGDSRLAFDAFFNLLSDALTQGEQARITITNEDATETA